MFACAFVILAPLTRDTSGLKYHRVTQQSDPIARRDRESDRRLPETTDGDGPASERGKKERVIHTRVPAVLERELKRFADNLRVPVSNLVRTILEDALDVADAATEGVEERLKRAAGKLEEQRVHLKKKVHFDPLAHVFAFQSITLAQDATCAKCSRELEAGEHAHMGLTDETPRQGRRIFVCDACVPKK